MHKLSLTPRIFSLGSLWMTAWTCAICHLCENLLPAAISFPELRSPWPAVGKRELWLRALGSALGASISGMRHRYHICRLLQTAHCARMRSKTGYAEFGYFHCYLKMDAPRALTRALVFRPLVKGNEALGTRLFRPRLTAVASVASR